MKTNIIFRLLLLTILSVLFLSNCDDISDTVYVSPEDSAAAIDRVGEANTALEGVMDGLRDADPDSVQEMLDIIDFSSPHALYIAAHDLNPYNLDANFGLAFTGFLMISQDDALQDMLRRWESYFNANEPFAAPSTMAKGGYHMPLSVDGIQIPVAPMLEMPFGLARMSVDDVPQFSELQELVGSLFLPVIEESIASLEILHDNPDYVFLVSAAMQGEAEADPIELDMTEFYLIEAGLYGLQGLLNGVMAYNFDFVTHDAAGIVTELSQGSAFATLNTNGSNLLSLAHASAISAFDKANLALDFLEAETDDQSNDLIQIDDIDDFTSVRETLDDAQSALEGPTLIHYNYWQDIYVGDDWVGEEKIEDSVTIDISQFFLNPIQDFKAMLPPYTMDTQLDYNYEYFWTTEHAHIEDSHVDIQDLDNAYLTINLTYYLDNDAPVLSAVVNMGFIYYDLTHANYNEIPVAVWDLYAEFLSLVETYSTEMYHYPNLNFYWGGSVTTGQSLVIDGDIYIEYEEQTSAYVIPDPTWNATTYADWLAAWPDPTMHNILPGMDAAGLADLFGFSEDDWNNF